MIILFKGNNYNFVSVSGILISMNMAILKKYYLVIGDLAGHLRFE